jgi:hypothetical protein
VKPEVPLPDDDDCDPELPPLKSWLPETAQLPSPNLILPGVIALLADEGALVPSILIAVARKV